MKNSKVSFIFKCVLLVWDEIFYIGKIACLSGTKRPFTVKNIMYIYNIFYVKNELTWTVVYSFWNSFLPKYQYCSLLGIEIFSIPT